MLSTCTACIPAATATLSTSPQRKLRGAQSNQSVPFCPPNYYNSPSTAGTLSIHSNETQISSQSAPIQRNPSISNTSFPYFLISNLPVPFHLEKPLATAHSGHFLHQIWQINILFKLCPLKIFLFTLDCPADPERSRGTPLCCQRWIL